MRRASHQKGTGNMYKRRNLAVQFILYFITLGIYAIYWFYSTADEMIRNTGMSGSAALWTILMFIPIINLFALWMHTSAADRATNGELNKVAMFVVALIIFPVYWLVLQSALNNRAARPAVA